MCDKNCDKINFHNEERFLKAWYCCFRTCTVLRLLIILKSISKANIKICPYNNRSSVKEWRAKCDLKIWVDLIDPNLSSSYEEAGVLSFYLERFVQNKSSAVASSWVKNKYWPIKSLRLSFINITFDFDTNSIV